MEKCKSAIKNYNDSYNTKARETEILTQSVDISSSLFNSARADYMEVLLTQREALQAKMELVETKAQLLHSKVKLYKALGGGWRQAGYLAAAGSKSEGCACRSGKRVFSDPLLQFAL